MFIVYMAFQIKQKANTHPHALPVCFLTISITASTKCKCRKSHPMSADTPFAPTWRKAAWTLRPYNIWWAILILASRWIPTPIWDMTTQKRNWKGLQMASSKTQTCPSIYYFLYYFWGKRYANLCHEMPRSRVKVELGKMPENQENTVLSRSFE